MDWEGFPPLLEDIVLVRVGGVPAGSLPAWDSLPVFRSVLLVAPYKLSDRQLQFQPPDRRSFKRFPRLRIDSKIPRNSDLDISQPLEHLRVFQRAD